MNTSTFSGWTALVTPCETPGAGPSQLAPQVNGATSNGRIRKRLPQEAYDILTQFFTHETTHPTKAQRIMLAERIRSILGAEGYTEQQVNNYFAGKRQGYRSRMVTATTRAGLFTSGHILYPSLVKDPSILQMLEVLLEDTSEPTLEIAAIWAERIGRGAKAVDIVTYARLRQAQRGHVSPYPPMVPSVSGIPSPPVVSMPRFPPLPPFRRSPPPPPRSQLPTPASSTSPEPHSPVVETTGRLTSNVRWDVEDEDEDVEDELQSENEMTLEKDKDSQHLYELDHDALQGLATALRDAISPPPGRIPKTFAELAQWINNDPTPAAFLSGIEKGEYARLGLGVGLPSPAPTD